MSLRALIFDCDGTLVDSEGIGTRVYVDYMGELGFELAYEEALRMFRGAKMADCIAILESRFETRLPEAFAADIRARMAEYFRRELRPIAGARALLEGLRVPFCVASSGPRAKMELTLSLTGLLPYFRGRIFSSYDIGTWKPDPGLFLHAAAALGVPPDDCGVVEDSLPGVVAGLAAGMRVFSLHADDVDSEIPAEARRIRGLGELPALLGDAVWTPPA